MVPQISLKDIFKKSDCKERAVLEEKEAIKKDNFL